MRKILGYEAWTSCCDYCKKWKASAPRIYRQTEGLAGDGDIIDEPDDEPNHTASKCPKCGKILSAVHVTSWYADESEGVLFVWWEKKV